MKKKQANAWLIPLLGIALVMAGGVAARADFGTPPEAPAPPEAPTPPAPPAPPQAPAPPRAPQAHVFVMGRHAWLGVRIAEVTAEKAQELKLPEPTGALIEEVVEDSPAARAGLQADDVIVGFAGEPVRSAAQLRRLVRETPPGRAVKVEVSRAGQRRSMEVTLEKRQMSFAVPRIHVPRIELPNLSVQVFHRGTRLGISGDELTPQLADYFGVQQGEGVLVREVLSDSPAQKAGLKAGDVIVQVGGEPVGNISELRHALAAEREGKQVTLTIVRNRREQQVTVELEEPEHRSPRHTTEGEWVDPDWDFDYEFDFETEVDEKTLEEIEERVRTMEERVRARLESPEFQKTIRVIQSRAREIERKVRKGIESPEFQEKLRDLERQAEELKRALETI